MGGGSSAPLTIGLAGPSCSGKSTVGRALAAALGEEATLLPADVYYRDLSHIDLDARTRTNFDHPEAIEHELLVEHLAALRRGEAVDRPVYDFVRHTRSGDVLRLEPGRLLIVEGLFVLHWEAVRALLDVAVFIDAPDSVCLARRIKRDVAERGRTESSVIAQFARTVRPMAEAYIRPSKVHAGVVLQGADAVASSLQKLRKALPAR